MNLIAAGEAIPAGVTARSNTSIFLPPQIPDLIGVEERRYLDHTGLVRQRKIGDLMRYCLAGAGCFRTGSIWRRSRERAEGPQRALQRRAIICARALSVFAPSTEESEPLRRRGERAEKEIFERAGCAACHAPPFYTNNKLIPVDGFTPPPADKRPIRSHGSPRRHRPSLRARDAKRHGLLQGPLIERSLVSGSARAQWLRCHTRRLVRSARLRDDYVPTGFKGYDGGPAR